MRPFIRLRGVDAHGVDLAALADRPVDVCIDGRRIWTFWTLRDTDSASTRLGRAWPLRHVDWPQPLRRHLTGRGRITVLDSATGAQYFDEELRFGDRDSPILVQNRRGVDLGIDKSGRLVPTFAGRSDGDIDALLDATEAVIAALRTTGAEPFLAYGTLLGAIREGQVLGHDSDADLGYVSQHSDPVDVARESFAMQRELARDGWRIQRYSGASFKILVTEADVTRGLDVFGGFLDGGRLHLMGEIGTEFERDWIYPLGSAELAGRMMPVPARPERLLEAMYGPGWRTPDPAFKFTTPDRTIRAFDAWFRGTQTGVRYWYRQANGDARKPLRDTPTALARMARRHARALGAEVLDIGAGRGSDSVWLARQGLAVTAYDYVPRALATASEEAEAASLDLDVRFLNLTDWRSVFSEGARLAQRPRPRVILARHLVDATSAAGRESLARLCSMSLREGGRLLAEFHLRDDRQPLPWMVGHPDVEAFTTLLRDAGASDVEVTHLERRGRRTVRLIGKW